MHGRDAEAWASARVRTEEKLDFPAWIARVNEYLALMHALFWPDVFILGGAVSERYDEFAPLLQSPAEVRPAHFAGQAGVMGAALAAAESDLTQPGHAACSASCPDVGTTIFTVMSRRARELGALNLGQGFPDYDIDPRLTELVAPAMSAGHNQYAPMEGCRRCASASPRSSKRATA